MGRFNIEVDPKFLPGDDTSTPIEAPTEPVEAAPSDKAASGRFNVEVDPRFLPGTTTTTTQPVSNDAQVDAYNETMSPEEGQDKIRDAYLDKKEAIDSQNIDENERYQGGEGLLGKTLEAVDYYGNIARSGIIGAVRGEGAQKYMGQAYRKERRTEVPVLRKELLTAAFGKDAGRDYNLVEGEFDAGDVIDLMRDVPLGFFTDPATLLTMGASGVTRAASGLKGLAPSTTKAIAKVAVGTEAASKAQKALTVGRASTAAAAGAYGYAAGDADNVVGNVATGAAAAAAVYGMGSALPKAKPLLTKAMDGLVDAYKSASRGTDAVGFGAGVRGLQTAKERVAPVALALVQRRLAVLEKLSPEEKARWSEVLDEQAGEFIRRKQFSISHDQDLDLLRQQKDMAVEAGDSAKALAAIDDKIMIREKQVQSLVGKDMTTPDYFKALVDREGEKVGKALEQHVANNKLFVREYNQVVNKMASGEFDEVTGKGLVGIPWHTDNPGVKRSLLEMDEAFAGLDDFQKSLRTKAKEGLKFKEKTALERSESNIKFDRDETYAIYANNAAMTFMKPAELEALKKVAEINALKPTAGYAKLEKVLDGFDWLTSISKNNMLGLSLSWLKNNFSDGLVKSFMTNDLTTLASSKAFTGLNRKILQDIYSADKARVSYLLKDKALSKEMIDEGAVSSNFFQVDKADDIAELVFRPEQLAEARSSTRNPLERLADFVKGSQDVATAPVFKTGQMMEDFFRANTYINVKKSLEMIPGMNEAMRRKVAAQVVKDTFFDYNKIHPFEKAVLKRLMPFYTYYSRNLGYWANQITDPKGLMKIQMGEHAKRAIGRDPTPEEYQDLPQYLKQGPRVLTSRDERDMRVLSFPQSSLYDAINTADPTKLMGLKDTSEFIQRANPWLKLPVEMATGEDLFTGAPIKPSQFVRETKTEGVKVGNKSAGSRGYGKAVIEKKLKDAGMPMWMRNMLGVGGSGIDPVSRKSVLTEDDSVIPGKILDLITPPLLWQGMNLYNRADMDPEGAKVVLPNTLLTPQMYDVPASQRETNRWINSRR